MAKQDSLEIIFYKGHFKEVAQFLNKKKIDQKLIKFKIAALCMLGEREEARLLFKNFHGQRNEIIFCLFWISVLEVRLQDFEQARSSIGKILSYRHQRLAKEERFYLFQVLGFYRFFKGNSKKSLSYAIKAWEVGYIVQKPFLQILALDLRGQILIKNRDFESGINLLIRAKNIAIKIENQVLSDTIQNSIYLFQSKCLLISVYELEEILSKTKAADAYSKTLLVLEIVSRLIFEGNIQKASQLLMDAKVSIFSSKNKRHILLWKEKINLVKELQQKSEIKNILQIPEFYSVDIAELINSKYQNVHLKKKFLDLGILSVFINLFISSHEKFIVDLIPDSVFIYDRGQLTFRKNILTPQIRSLILLLSQGAQSKDDIVRKIYGYDYESLRHDPMIYSLIHRARDIFKGKENWIEFKNDKYSFKKELKFQFFEQINPDEYASKFELQIPVTLSSSLQNSLSYRQLWILQKAHQGGFVKPNEIVSEFKVTAMTAYRDLNDLLKRNLIFKKGFGRNTHYLILGS